MKTDNPNNYQISKMFYLLDAVNAKVTSTSIAFLKIQVIR
jgi:hypothetical protein